MGGPVLVKVDVPGAEAAGKGLKAIDPARYGSLEHPGDGFSFDIFTQVARAVRSGAGMSGLQPQARLIAAGESQSAFALVTYYNGVQPLTHAFDGFLVHSRGAAGLPLVAPGEYADIAGSISGTSTIFRTDQDAPVLDIQTETDVRRPQLLCRPANPTTIASGSGKSQAPRTPTSISSGRPPSTSIAAYRSTTARCTLSSKPHCARSRTGSKPERPPLSRRVST